MSPIEMLEKLVNCMAGMQFDPAIPDHAKQALSKWTAEAEAVLEENQD